jgi:hypothetical protein
LVQYKARYVHLRAGVGGKKQKSSKFPPVHISPADCRQSSGFFCLSHLFDKNNWLTSSRPATPCHGL